MTENTMPEAERLAKELRGYKSMFIPEVASDFESAAALLERLHAVEQEAERLRAVLDEIGGLCCHLRHGGPDPMDLDDLSNALATAVDMAHDAMQSTKDQS